MRSIGLGKLYKYEALLRISFNKKTDYCFLSISLYLVLGLAWDFKGSQLQQAARLLYCFAN